MTNLNTVGPGVDNQCIHSTHSLNHQSQKKKNPILNYGYRNGLLSLQFYFLLLRVRGAVLSDISEERVNQKSNPQWDLGKNMYLFCGERKKVISFPCAEPAQFDTVSLLFHYFSCELIMGQRIGLNCCLQPNNSAQVSSVA